MNTSSLHLLQNLEHTLSEVTARPGTAKRVDLPRGEHLRARALLVFRGQTHGNRHLRRKAMKLARLAERRGLLRPEVLAGLQVGRAESLLPKTPPAEIAKPRGILAWLRSKFGRGRA